MNNIKLPFDLEKLPKHVLGASLFSATQKVYSDGAWVQTQLETTLEVEYKGRYDSPPDEYKGWICTETTWSVDVIYAIVRTMCRFQKLGVKENG